MAQGQDGEEDGEVGAEEDAGEGGPKEESGDAVPGRVIKWAFFALRERMGLEYEERNTGNVRERRRCCV